MRPFVAKGLMPQFPFGSEFTDVELATLPALLWLKKSTADWKRWPAVLGALLAPGHSQSEAAVLERLGLSRPSNVAERITARLVRGALVRSGR